MDLFTFKKNVSYIQVLTRWVHTMLIKAVTTSYHISLYFIVCRVFKSHIGFGIHTLAIWLLTVLLSKCYWLELIQF